MPDASRCTKEATHANGVFCWFHSKQVYGLYKGYKRRNAELDARDAQEPLYLKNAKIPLANQTFEDIEDATTLRTVHSHLYEKYVLIGQVIDARKLHHTHFYSLQVDYGHQAYIDKLSSQRHTVLRSLEKLEKRTADVLYQKEQWFAWVRKVQEEEEATREKEQKKIKQEAALFKRHREKLQARLEQARREEEKRSQDAYLEDAFQERMSLSADEADGDEAWDPIKDMDDDKRNQYIDLIKHFLWMDVASAEDSKVPPINSAVRTEEVAPAEEVQAPIKKTKKRSNAKGGASKPADGSASQAAHRGQDKLVAMQEGKRSGAAADKHGPDKNNIETEQEMRKRLSQGVDKKLDNVWGLQLVGSVENPHETHTRTAPMTDDEIDSAVKDIREIKLLLFCRLLLAQASMLPAALRAGSVQELLDDAEIVDSDLRDLCLKLEDPTLQQIRDACADFARGDEEEEDLDDASDESETEDEDDTFADMMTANDRYRHLHTKDWLLDKLLGRKPRPSQRKSSSPSQKSRVTICGKSVWNHASQKAMSRDGWLQFSIIAKDCDLKHAIQLCRNWAEFSDLNLLTLWQYFPASNWASWANNRLIQQLQELEFYPYFIDLDAQQHSRHFQVGGRGRIRRQHDIIETRNIIAGHMKRSDPVTRRFLQYLVMRTGELLVLVRDGKTGRVITAPPEEHLWTYRRKQGIGRASKNEWHNVLEVGPDYFEMTDTLREWHFGFHDYYDVFIWDFVPDQSPMEMYNVVITELRTAWRITQPQDVYAHMEPLLRTLTREKDTMRTRKINRGEEVESLWDTVMGDEVEYRLFDVKGDDVSWRTPAELAASPYLFYNKANVAEDEILFPDELISNRQSVPFREVKNGVNRIESPMFPSHIRHLEKGMTALREGKDPFLPLEDARDDDEDSIWALPKVWETGLEQFRQGAVSTEQRELLERTGLDTINQSQLLADRLDDADPLEIMERDRSFGFKESFHQGDLEPGCTERYSDVQDKIGMMLNNAHTGATEWVLFVAEILDWLQIRADYDDYAGDPAAPWPHPFVVQDLVQAFMTIAMFFPEQDATSNVTAFLQSDQCENFKNSLLFNPQDRGKTPPGQDRRSRTSYKYRAATFWSEWKDIAKQKSHYTDIYPLEWSLIIRPIIAKLYRAGIIAPGYYQNDPQIVPGVATAMTEPHRPNERDLFICYEDRYNQFPVKFPPFFSSPSQWTNLLPRAETFAGKHPGARFALLRLWSAPHFYPLMVGLQNRQGNSFLDSVGRPWEWKFVPKDMPGSEFSIHHTVGSRLELLRKQFGDKVVSRGDLILVMGEEAADLLKHCTAVTFALQTKPWLREVDLWKSFINVELGLLQGLDPSWLE
ncbi:mfs allantoate [Trichoderma arundinaceum]|uniref:Mfs allantoate n=1 Tax=Trichoderma arundinaceum TaxID=490622 RepID=A0A395NKP1_TRIAR|nr:mfs allantoate [Trichoderma arundinaceum]